MSPWRCAICGRDFHTVDRWRRVPAAFPSFGGRRALQWAGLAQVQKGTLVVAIPTTDLVLYAAEEMPLATDALRTLARRIMAKASNPLSDAILRWTPTGWVPVN